MNFKTLTCAILTSAALVSCQEELIEKRADGKLTLSVENSPLVETVTKAGETSDTGTGETTGTTTVNTDNFTVYINKEDGSLYQSGLYSSYKGKTITLPAGNYTVSAENMTDAMAHPKDGIGSRRYFGISTQQAVAAGQNPTSFNVQCTMANTAVSITFDPSLDTHFANYAVQAWVDNNRVVTYEKSASSEGYFPANSTLNYSFAGIKEDETSPSKTYTGSYQLQPATHVHLTFKLKEQTGGDETTDGSLGLTIEVITDCDDLYREITVDPSDGSYTFVDKNPENGGDNPETK